MSLLDLTSKNLRLEVEGEMLTITIDRPDALNALDRAMHDALSRVFDAYAADPILRVAILTGSGQRAFCVGSDLKERQILGRDEFPDSGFGGLAKRFDLQKPVIAAVNGLCLGGGLEMALAADLIIASQTATFGFPEPRIGLAASQGLHRLARKISVNFAMELALTASSIDAERAERVGLVNRVTEPSLLLCEAKAIASEVLAGAPLAITATRQIILDSPSHATIEEAFRAKYPAYEAMLSSTDAMEGLAAFVEKRAPVWTRN